MVSKGKMFMLMLSLTCFFSFQYLPLLSAPLLICLAHIFYYEFYLSSVFLYHSYFGGFFVVIELLHSHQLANCVPSQVIQVVFFFPSCQQVILSEKGNKDREIHHFFNLPCIKTTLPDRLSTGVE